MWRITAFDRDGREVSRLEVGGGEITIGRDTDRQMVLPSASVSRKHAKLVLSGPQPFIVDEGSANGVVVNGVRIAGPTAVVPGVRVDIAEFHLEFETPSSTDSVAPISARNPNVDPNDVIRLVAEGGPFDGKVYEIPPGDLVVGRAVDNDLVLDDPSLSRKHAKLRRAGIGRLDLEDLGSSNGTFVNNRKIGKGSAGPRDTVRFGELTLRVEGSAAGGTRGNQASGSSSAIFLWGGIGLAVIAIGVAGAIYFLHKPGGGKDAITQMAEQAAQHVKVGQDKLADKKFDIAASEFEEALRLDPGNKLARKLKAQAEAEPGNKDLSNKVSVKADLASDKSAFDAAVRLYGKITPESVFRPVAGAKLSRKLIAFGQDQLKARKYADAAWAVCSSYDVAPADQRPGADAAQLLKDAEKKLVKDNTYTPCKKH